ncbi:hypothetical protein [Pseudomonas svalbardensis]|uniref:hypothetical protein n=1 Tax=Pseudomonas svalbardensis TaxID=3042029 RepID=UPI0024B38B72|nr:hypothetical protein [Pseudomonas sp. PMCC200367]
MNSIAQDVPTEAEFDFLEVDEIKDIFAVTSIISSNGKRIACRYMESEHFDAASNLCECLHWLFVLFSSDANHTNGYTLRSSIEELLDFVALHNARNPEALHVKRYTDINSEIFNGYQDYISSQGRPNALAIKLKTAIKKVADETGKLPFIKLPVISVDVAKKTEPLYKDGFESLERACFTQIEGLYRQLAFRTEVEKAEPYIAAEVMEELRPKPTRERLLKWEKHVQLMNRDAHRDSYRSRFRRCPDPEIQALADDKNGIKKFREVYRNEYSSITYDGIYDPFETGGISGWALDYARVVKTFIVNGYPFDLDQEMVVETYGQDQLGRIEEDCNDIIKILLYRVSTGNIDKSKVRTLHIDRIMGLYFPSVEDMAALLIFMMFQSGWNKETVLAVDQDNFEHTLTGVIEAAVKIVFSEKNRSQANGKPFEKPKRIHLPSRDDDPFSFYNLVYLAKSLSEPLAKYPLDQMPTILSREDMNPLFLCIRKKADWRRGGRYTSIAYKPTFSIAVKNLLKIHKVIDNGKRLTSASELTRRLRPTWFLHKKKHHSIAMLSHTMGHKDRDTTDIFYDDSGVARQQRKARLRTELDAVIHLLRTRQFKGLLSKHAQAEASGQLKIFHIPGHDRPLWACSNQEKPDWVGSDIIASTGKKCFAISECIFCSQMRVFQETLPFLMERAAHLEEIINERGDENVGFDSRFSKEYEAIQYILDKWGDDDDITAAARYRRRHAPLLPRDLKILEIIFDSENHNV